MSRTRLAAFTALGIVIVAVGVFITRRATGGVDVGGPAGASSWEVTITARGQLPNGRDVIVTSAPPDFRHQHVYDEAWKSNELNHHESRGDVAKGSDREREATWKRRPMTGVQAANYRLTYSFRCVLGAHRPTHAMNETTRRIDGAPRPDHDGTLRSTPRIQSDHREIADTARELAGDSSSSADQLRAFYDYVLDLPPADEPNPGTALDCLRGGGDDLAKSRLLVALCRSRSIPARVVGGLVLNPNAPPVLHHWVEAFVRSPDGPEGSWLPCCPTYGQFGTRRWPTNYLVVRHDDEPLVRGPGNPQVTFFAKPLTEGAQAGEPAIRAFWRAVSLSALPPSEQQLARFLLLLPLAAVIVCVFRVLIGTRTFGVFAPALLGLIFRDLTTLPLGMAIFAVTVLVGWLFRKVLDKFHLLLIPRTAVLLTVVIGFLLLVTLVAAKFGLHVTGYLALFPLIILTHMVERFWTVEAEDGPWASFRTLVGTMFVTGVIALALSPDVVSRWMFRFPETLGVVIAGLLLLGRYTGYRITELYRFRDVIEFAEKPEPPREAEAETSAAAEVQTPVTTGA